VLFTIALDVEIVRKHADLPGRLLLWPVNALTPWAVPKIAWSLGWLRNLFAATVLIDLQPPHRGSAVRRRSRKQSWQRRITALAAAYAVALSSLLASFGAARAAAEATANPLGAICHHDLAGQPAPLNGGNNSNICIDCCCVGCLMPMAALPPPPAIAAPVLVAVIYRLAPLAIAPLPGARAAKSHRSRAPPFGA
jgi:hypothetical protein